MQCKSGIIRKNEQRLENTKEKIQTSKTDPSFPPALGYWKVGFLAICVMVSANKEHSIIQSGHKSSRGDECVIYFREMSTTLTSNTRVELPGMPGMPLLP